MPFTQLIPSIKEMLRQEKEDKVESGLYNYSRLIGKGTRIYLYLLPTSLIRKLKASKKIEGFFALRIGLPSSSVLRLQGHSTFFTLKKYGHSLTRTGNCAAEIMQRQQHHRASE